MTPHSEIAYWNDPDVASGLRAESHGVTDFAKEVEARLAPASHVLELGCGAGDDAAYFAEHGHTVTAIDVSEPLINVASQRFANLPDIRFERADVSRPLSVGGQSCHAVYARLSLYYFDDEVTTRIFGETSWVLRSGGWFFFICKSTDDPLYGKGIEVGPDMFELDGHVRHFFSRQYALELMEDAGFTNLEVETGKAKFYRSRSAYVKCAGMKP